MFWCIFHSVHNTSTHFSDEMAKKYKKKIVFIFYYTGDKNDKSNQRSNYSFVQANDACFLFIYLF